MTDIFLFQPSVARQFIFTPIGLISLASSLKKSGFDSKIIDLRVNQHHPDWEYDKIMTEAIMNVGLENARIVGISILSHEEAAYADKLGTRIRKSNPDVCMVIGGYFASCLRPDEIFDIFAWLDGIFIGEAEKDFVDFSKMILSEGGNHRDFHRSNYISRIENQGGVRKIVPSTTNLNDIASMDYSLLGNIQEYSIFLYELSRGCPHNCSHCIESRVSLRDYRIKPIMTIEQELKSISSIIPKKFILISDCIIGVSRLWEDIFQSMSNYSFEFLAEGRVDFPLRIIPLAYRAGLRIFWIGLESASYNTLIRLRKVNDPLSYERYLSNCTNLVKELIRNDITPGISLMIGIPEDNEQDFAVTLKFICDLRREALNVMEITGNNPGLYIATSRFKVFKQTEIYENLKDYQSRGFVVDTSEEKYGVYRVIKPSPSIDLDDLYAYMEKIKNLEIQSEVMNDRLRNLGVSK